MDARTRRFALPHGVALAADSYGDAQGPPVLLLHGGGQTRHAWGSTAAALAEAGYHAISLDLRGHGDSDWAPDGRYDPVDFASDLEAVAAQLPSPPALVGASLGGITSLHYATAHGGGRGRCEALVLVDVTPRLEREGVLRILRFMAAHPDGFAKLEDAADAVAAYLPHRRRPRDLSGLRKNLRRGEDGRWRWHWDPALLETWRPERYSVVERDEIIGDRMARAARLDVPTLLVRGRSSDVVSEETAREFLDVVPHAEYVDLVGASHMVAGDRNDRFQAAVVAFLRRVLPCAPVRSSSSPP